MDGQNPFVSYYFNFGTNFVKCLIKCIESTLKRIVLPQEVVIMIHHFILYSVLLVIFTLKFSSLTRMREFHRTKKNPKID